VLAARKTINAWVEKETQDRIKNLLPEGSLAGDTVYIAVVDKDGNAASLIHSLYGVFGAAVVAGRTGVVLQNRSAYFSLDPTSPNKLEPGKRPFHTIIPAMVTKDFEELFACFNARRVKGVIVGGYALSFHAKPRFTKDIDVFVEPSPEKANGSSRRLPTSASAASAKPMAPFLREAGAASVRGMAFPEPVQERNPAMTGNHAFTVTEPEGAWCVLARAG
jgi:hypothetical protein